MPVDAHLLDSPALAPPLARLLDDPDAQPTDVAAIRLSAGAGQGLGVYRVCGHAHSRNQLLRWSTILKILPASAEHELPDDWCYSERELLAYRSGLVRELPGGLQAPRCLSLDRHERGNHHLWLEDLGPHQQRWTSEDYERAARCLGRLNGAYLAGHHFPAHRWLSRDWLARWLAATAPAISLLAQHRDHPLVRRVYPTDIAARIAMLWADRDRLLQALDRLPQTLCHHDAFRRNLVAHGDRIVALDWAFVGRGPVGAELSPLVSATLAFREIDRERRPELERIVFTSYVAGLRDAGWHGPEEQVWFGFAATSALRYGPGTVRLVLPVLLDEADRDRVLGVLGIPFDQVLDHWASVIRDDVLLHDRTQLATAWK